MPARLARETDEREQRKDEDASYRAPGAATGEPDVWQAESDCSQNITQFFHCPSKQIFHVSKVSGSGYSGTLPLFPVKWIVLHTQEPPGPGSD